MSALVEFMQARSIEAGVDALAEVVAPALNVVLADAGGVGLATAGRAPRRHIEHQGRGRIPAPGWVASNDWTGYLTWDEAPKVIRPESGAVANANNRLTDAPFPLHLSYDWGDTYRIRRIEKQLNARRFHTRDSFAALQNDAVSEMARAVLPLIARDLWWTGDAEPSDPREARRREALDMLGEWNGEMSEHAPEPLIFAEWMRRLTDRLAADELGPAFAHVAGARPVFVERVFRDVDGAAVWCDVDKTVREETCAEMATLALDDALGALAEEFGGAPSGWRWGEAHRTEHRHEVLGRLGLFGLVANLRHEASGGDHTLLRSQSRGRGEEPHEVVSAAGFRGVFDFADPDSSIYVIATGESGHPLSRHYDDLSQLWRRGDYIRMSLNPEHAEAGAEGVTVLTPEEK